MNDFVHVTSEGLHFVIEEPGARRSSFFRVLAPELSLLPGPDDMPSCRSVVRSVIDGKLLTP